MKHVHGTWACSELGRAQVYRREGLEAVSEYSVLSFQRPSMTVGTFLFSPFVAGGGGVGIYVCFPPPPAFPSLYACLGGCVRQRERVVCVCVCERERQTEVCVCVCVCVCVPSLSLPVSLWFSVSFFLSVSVTVMVQWELKKHPRPQPLCILTLTHPLPNLRVRSCVNRKVGLGSLSFPIPVFLRP